MKYFTALAIVFFTGVHANAHPIVPIVAGGGGHTASAVIGGSSGATIPVAPAIFIGGVFVSIAAHEFAGPACASNTKYNRAHGYDTPAFWRPKCNWRHTSNHHHTPVKFIKPFSK